MFPPSEFLLTPMYKRNGLNKLLSGPPFLKHNLNKMFIIFWTILRGNVIILNGDPSGAKHIFKPITP